MVENFDIKSGEIVLKCKNFEESFRFYTEELNFRIESIFPADNPREAVLFGYGLRICLKKSRDGQTENVRIRLNCEPMQAAKELIAPNGVKIEFVDSNLESLVPKLEPSLVINKLSENADWIEGRAGMRYRDLIPDRLGGYVIASHIHIPDAGPVPDYVHFHKVRFQMIYCYKGWVKVVYEDQGEPFVMNEGDCVLQPPEIRHRVLEASENLEVIELSSPAEHITYADHEMTLPNSNVNTEREFDGQRFVRHIASEADWKPWRASGFECRDTGIEKATRGLASAKIVRARHETVKTLIRNDAEVLFAFILKGSMNLDSGAIKDEPLNAGDSFVIPGGEKYSYSDLSVDLETLEVRLF